MKDKWVRNAKTKNNSDKKQTHTLKKIINGIKIC